MAINFKEIEILPKEASDLFAHIADKALRESAGKGEVFSPEVSYSHAKVAHSGLQEKSGRELPVSPDLAGSIRQTFHSPSADKVCTINPALKITKEIVQSSAQEATNISNSLHKDKSQSNQVG